MVRQSGPLLTLLRDIIRAIRGPPDDGDDGDNGNGGGNGDDGDNGNGGGGEPDPPAPRIEQLVVSEEDESTTLVSDGDNVVSPPAEERVDDGENYSFRWGVKNAGGAGNVVVEIEKDATIQDRYVLALSGGEEATDRVTLTHTCCGGDTDDWSFTVYEEGNQANGERYEVIIRESGSTNGGL